MLVILDSKQPILDDERNTTEPPNTGEKTHLRTNFNILLFSLSKLLFASALHPPCPGAFAKAS